MSLNGSYATVEESNEYFINDYLRSDKWASLDDTSKEKLLITATNDLNTYFLWNGEKVEDNQSLPFPRIHIFCNNEELTEDEINVRIIESTCEMAYNIYAKSTGETGSATTAKGINSVTVDVISVDFDSSVNEYGVNNLIKGKVGCLGSLKSEFEESTNTVVNGTVSR